MQEIARGIWPTMITPYDASGKVDHKAVRHMVDWYAEQGCNGVFAVCQSSEMFYLSLEERVALARTVVDAAQGRLEVIASGHIADTFSGQVEELGAIAQTGVKAVVMVSNRLAGELEDDGVWIENAQKILDVLPEITFGLYECPHPYKRLMTDDTLKWCVQTGRFGFLKDTCCNAEVIRHRLGVINRAAAAAGKKPLGLYNANTMTLLQSLQDGAAGFSGVMGNLHPELYVWIYQNWRSQPEKADELQALLTLLSGLEEQGYPICAKQHMNDACIPMTLKARCQPPSVFGYAQREMLRQAEIVEGIARRLCDLQPRKGGENDG